MAKATPGNNYAVVAGDTLWSIAQQAYNNGDHWQQIYDANKGTIGSDPNSLKAGTVLYIPQVQGHTSTYTVKAGDTLWSIAQHLEGNGNAWQKIYDANKQVIGPDPNALHAGMVLHIP
ncbi:MAG: LysM peptidoglycan-binding domain-containing protein [Ktedonobacteraceae bacterium]|nr:LysM peptidoglycan-binding domain-containing protein [Ktedonobacteraceae bacterium]